jgi:hypothetical protein
MIPCIVIPVERSSVFRQAKENTSRTGLSAIAMARQAALLLLTVHGYEIPDIPVDNDFYRQALDLDLRGKREYTEAILSAMGGITKSQFSRSKGLLQLADEALELADRYELEERKLRPVLLLDPELHLEVVRQIIDFNLTSRQVQQLCESELTDLQSETQEEVIPKQALKMVRAFRTSSEMTAPQLAQALIQQERSIPLAKARLQTLRQLLDATEHYLMEK